MLKRGDYRCGEAGLSTEPGRIDVRVASDLIVYP